MIQGGRTAAARSPGPVATRPVWTASPLAQSGRFARVAAGAFGWGRKPNPVTVTTTPEPAAPPPATPATAAAPKPAPAAPTPAPTPAPSPVPPPPAAPQAPAAAAAPVVVATAAGAAGGALATKGDTGKVAVRFWLKFRVEYGQSIAIVGGSKALGAWDVSKAPRLSWSDGDLWNVTLDLDAGTVYEYKYVVISHDGHNPAAWQWGANGVIALRWADKKVELFDNWGNGPGALVITDGAEATREQKLLGWVGEFASARAELARAKTELAAAKEELRVLRAEVGVRRAEAADAESRNKSLEQEIAALRAQLDSGRARTRATLAEASRLLDMFDDVGKKINGNNGNGLNGNNGNGKSGAGKPPGAPASQAAANGGKAASVGGTEPPSSAAAAAAAAGTAPEAANGGANGSGGFFDIFSGLNPLGRPAAPASVGPGVANGMSAASPDAAPAAAVPRADDSARGGGSRPAPAAKPAAAAAASSSATNTARD